MSNAYEYRYDRQANALYIRIRSGESARQQEFSEDILVDLDSNDVLLGIEVLDPEADLAGLVRHFNLDPHLLDVVAKIRQLIPESRQHVLLA